MIAMPDEIEFMTADEIAETMNVNQETYSALWNIVTDAKNTKPLGGDGSGGTVEWPEATNHHDDQPKYFWAKLNCAARQDIVCAVEKEREA